MAHITDLPVEVVLLLLKILSCYDLCTLARTCTFFRRICNMDDTWQYFCGKDYGINSIDKWSVDSFMELYKTVPFKFGHLIGKWWKVNIYPYGGLLSVEVEPGRFVCYLCHAPRHNCITNPFMKQELFELKIENKKCVRNCLSGKSVHPLEKIIYLDGQLPRFSFECGQPTYHPNCEVNSAEYQQWYAEESSVFDQENVFEKYKAYTELHGNIECERLQWPDPVNSESLPTPGLYKGTYGGHGVEIIMVHVSSDQIIGTKITGDPNIPATKISFKANISQVVTHSEINGVAVTEFQLPDGYESEYDAFPNEVKTRYHCVGQIADQGYRNPCWTPGHFILFSKNCFAVLWFELYSLSVYSRVEN